VNNPENVGPNASYTHPSILKWILSISFRVHPKAFFLEGATFIGPSLAYLPSYLVSVTFFPPTNLSTYMSIYSSNLSSLLLDLPFYLQTFFLTQLPTYIPTYLPMHPPSYLPLCSPTYFCFLHSQILN